MSIIAHEIRILFQEVPPECIHAIDAINLRRQSTHGALVSMVRRHFTGRELRLLNMFRDEDLDMCVYAYRKLRRRFPEMDLHDNGSRPPLSGISDTALSLVHLVFTRRPLLQDQEVHDLVSRIVQERYGETYSLELNLASIGLSTTGKIWNAIRSYQVMRWLFPTSRFLQDSGSQWEEFL